MHACEQWEQRADACAHRLRQLPWDTQGGHPEQALVPAMLGFVRKHSGDARLAALCSALGTHQPGMGDVARLPDALMRGDSRARRNAESPRTRWVRCDKHGAWCAVGAFRNDDKARRDATNRWVVAMHAIATASRSCEEFRARRKRIPDIALWCANSGQYGTFAHVAPGKWMRVDKGPGIAVHCNTIAWGALPPALDDWDAVAAASLSG
jgi:hypothetical protein